MEPATQALAAIALSRTGLNRLTPHATPILIAAALAPDLDLLSVAGGASTYLHLHRTLFHSLPGGIALALVLAAAATTILNPRKPSLSSFLCVSAVSFSGLALHLVLDLSDAEGLRLLWPFRPTWQGWYLTPNLDPIILMLLIASIALPALFRLVSEEIGERKKHPHVPRRWAIAALTLIALYLGARATLHSQAIDLLQSAIYRGEVPLSVGAYPDSISPFKWRGIAATDNTLQEIEIHLEGDEKFDPDRAITHYKPAQPQILAAAEKASAVRAFLQYARFPIASVQQTDSSSWHVELRDLRIPATSTTWDNAVAAVDITPTMQIQDEEIRFAH
ncbi:MAG TPA: metal-dependent hydrolase [Candidatus Acidoferrales bacterium]|nr:metal-dependent hydrolase [Candidatus Acidoferrales bacterium]